LGRRSSRQIPESEWFVFEDHHEAMSSKELFDKASGIIDKTAKSGIVDHDGFALKLVLYCGNGGMRLHHKRSTSKNVYCRHKQRTGEYSSCSDAVYPVDRIKSIVSRALYNQIKLMRELSDGLELKKQKLPDISSDVRRINSQISALNTEKTELYEAYAENRVSKIDYLSRRDQIRTKVDQLQIARNKLTADADALKDLQGSADHYAVLADQIDFAKGLTREQVDAFIERVNIYNEDNYEIIFKFDDLLKRIIREVEAKP
jgi:outer membrane murein-binding lipoprotein Lpp